MSLLALALTLGWAQDIPATRVCPDGTVLLASETCTEPAVLRGRCTPRAGQAPALHDAWLFELDGRVMTAGPEGDAAKYLGVMAERRLNVLQGTLVAKGGARVEFALLADPGAIDNGSGAERPAAIVPLDAAGKHAQAPSGYVCRIRR